MNYLLQTKYKLIKPFLNWSYNNINSNNNNYINIILSKIPKSFNNYYELFLGDGQLLLNMLLLKKYKKCRINGKIYAYDNNPYLVRLFRVIKNHKDEFYKYIKKYKDNYLSIEQFKSIRIDNKKRQIPNPTCIKSAKLSKEAYYYWIRKQFNQIKDNTKTEEDLIKNSAMFLFLNKTCFRGLYRDGPNGFNVPFGHYKNIDLFNKRELNKISRLLKDVMFQTISFKESIDMVQSDDLVILNPPTVINTKTFSYKTSFDNKDIEFLYNKLENLNNNSVFFLLLLCKKYNDKFESIVKVNYSIKSLNEEYSLIYTN